MRKIVALAIMIAAALGGSADDGASLAGLCGEALATRIAQVYKPGKDAEPAVLPQWMGGGVATRLVPESWTDGEAIDDAYNLAGASAAFIAARKDYVPGNLVDTLAGDKDWLAGLALLGDVEINAWMPADDRRGDVARRYMYMAVIYSRELWHGQAPMLLADGNWPLLTGYGIRLLMDWHQADPVDERELSESGNAGGRQLNENPFVTLPGLADHIWGDKSAEGFVPPAKRERIPLKGYYSRSADRQIDLYSQYVPEAAEWTLDGRAVDGVAVPLDGVANGVHTLGFAAGTVRGRVKIEITD